VPRTATEAEAAAIWQFQFVEVIVFHGIHYSSRNKRKTPATRARGSPLVRETKSGCPCNCGFHFRLHSGLEGRWTVVQQLLLFVAGSIAL
jgi:hypothetical protein